MRAWLLPKLGTIDSLVLTSVDDPPSPAADEVVVRLRYAALNPADRYLAEGQYPARPQLPHILGRDGMGIVERVGATVEAWKPGDKAVILRGEAGVNRPGTLAELVCVPAECLTELPSGWSEAQAASAALVYVTAFQALTQWGDQPPGVVLISGASGGVGVAAVQLAHAMGHTVIGLSRSKTKGEKLLEIGADRIFDANDSEWSSQLKAALKPKRVNLIVDNIGGPQLPAMIDTLGMNGVISVVGMLAGSVPQFNTASLFFRRLRIGGVAIGTYSIEENRAAWQRVLALLEKTGQHPLVDSIHEMDEVPAAFARLAEGPMGKVVIKIID